MKNKETQEKVLIWTESVQLESFLELVKAILMFFLKFSPNLDEEVCAKNEVLGSEVILSTLVLKITAFMKTRG